VVIPVVNLDVGRKLVEMEETVAAAVVVDLKEAPVVKAQMVQLF
jgi:deoxyinosine 3'endonuclease (endonuclease V)